MVVEKRPESLPCRIVTDPLDVSLEPAAAASGSLVSLGSIDSDDALQAAKLSKRNLLLVSPALLDNFQMM